MDDDTYQYVIKGIADDFLKSDFNAEIRSDAQLEFSVAEYLRSQKLNPKHSKKIANVILKNQQSRINYSFDF